MIPNLKVDIIYYKTQSDFELEFNLSGYCRMRIFKSSANTPEELLNSLACDLDRSRVILVVTDVLGNDCGVATISDAVGLKLEPIDKTALNIKSTDEIFIPKNAVPLVSKSGAYGGCIAESGVQSIIMITDNRALRHDIMKTLVHQYIFDIAQLEAYKQRQKIEEKTIEVEEVASSSPQSAENNEQGFELNEESKPSEIGNGIFSAPGTNLVINNPDRDLEQEDEPNDTEPVLENKRKRGSDFALLIIAILLLIAFGILAYFFIYLPVSSGSFSFGGNGNDFGKAIETWLFH